MDDALTELEEKLASSGSIQDLDDETFLKQLAQSNKDAELGEEEAKLAEAYEQGIEEERKAMMVVTTLVDATIARKREATDES